MRRVYLDYSATTPVDERVFEAMKPYYTEMFGNANSLHCFGREGATAVDTSRRKIAALLDVKPTEIYFTSGGTEGDNWALKGVASAYRNKGRRIIVSSVEHAAMIASAKQLESDGFDVVFLPVDGGGRVLPEFLEKVITDDTVLVSVMTANNEIGTVQPIKELAEIAHKHGAYFHTDAVQAVGAIPIDIRGWNVDMLTFSAHKFYGPKGIGALFIKSGIKPSKIITGGHQERSMRGGTTNVPAVVGMAAALELALDNLEENSVRIGKLRDYFVEEIEKKVPYAIYNGDRVHRVPQNANFAFEFIEGESLLLVLRVLPVR